MKIVWRVGEIPTGRYRSFEKRSWPAAYIGNADGPIVCQLYCDDGYEPRRVKTGDHAEIKIMMVDSSPETMEARNGSWRWRTLVKRAATLQEAKDRVTRFYEAHPDWLPRGNSKP